MIELVSRVKGRYIFLCGRDWIETYRITCDICGHTHDQKRTDYSYGNGPLPLGYMNDYGGTMIRIGYGQYNQRSIQVCRSHRDAEIKKKIEELI
jgi:hypothetical protein